GSFVVTMFFSTLGALVTGSGFTFRPFGAALVNARGQRASRLRALWRAAVTWTPLIVTLIVVKLAPNPPNYRVDLLVLETALMAFVAGAAAWAVAHPSRSLQDRLAGTWIVPRWSPTAGRICRHPGGGRWTPHRRATRRPTPVSPRGGCPTGWRGRLPRRPP